MRQKAKASLTIKIFWQHTISIAKADTVNVFNLLIKNLLANVINDVTGQSIAEDWKNILEILPSRRNATQQIATLKGQLENFNRELRRRLEQLKTQASEILRKFGYKDNVVVLDFDFQGISYNRDSNSLDNQQILLTVQFFDQESPEHHRLLNEAKLSAIALSIYFAGILLQVRQRPEDSRS